MGSLKRLTIFLICCVLGAALISPLIYQGLQQAADISGWGWVKYLAHHPFHRVFNRTLQIELFLGIGFLLKRDGFFSFQALGFKDTSAMKHLGLGFASSVLLMGGYAALVLGMGWEQWEIRVTGWQWARLAVKILTTAIVVSLVLEEPFFRGYVYQLCRRRFNFPAALTMNMLLFSLVHFVQPAKANMSVDWSSGFQMLALSCQRFAHPLGLLGGFLVLMTVAWILCWSVERTRSLWLAIGLHAGWICVQQWNVALTQSSTTLPAWVFGDGELRNGIVTIFPLVIQFCLLKWSLRHGQFGKGQELPTSNVEHRTSNGRLDGREG